MGCTGWPCRLARIRRADAPSGGGRLVGNVAKPSQVICSCKAAAGVDAGALGAGTCGPESGVPQKWVTVRSLLGEGSGDGGRDLKIEQPDPPSKSVATNPLPTDIQRRMATVIHCRRKISQFFCSSKRRGSIGSVFLRQALHHAADESF